MGRLFITGDTHNNIDIYKLNTKHFAEQKDLTIFPHASPDSTKSCGVSAASGG